MTGRKPCYFFDAGLLKFSQADRQYHQARDTPNYYTTNHRQLSREKYEKNAQKIKS